ncbi:transposase [Streptomyces cinnabarinus]|uniref:Transposase n=1 Tax=Streptomyces cinnabarinus TaxID=67287 RepID=A0ABY7KSH5_9ACTN|nr:transposase [Streptomyces cinnabarinus]WAZ26963.1 transposase [Streptomyces cinnabarinus]
MRDRLDELFTDEDFTDWYPSDGRRGLSPARLAMVSVLQYAENLTDRQAAEAVRCRLDWKYCLGLELDDPGFDFSVLSEFRDRMARDDRADRLLAVMVDRLACAGLVKRRGAVRTDSTHVLAAVRTLNRTELVTETLRAALEQLVLADGQWLAPLITADWADRYGRPAFYHRLPKGKAALEEYVLQVGADGLGLLTAVFADDAPPRLRALPQVELLRQVWVQQYWHDGSGRLRWRDPKSHRDRLSRRDMARTAALPPGAEGRPDPDKASVPWASMEIVSPYDPEARYCQKLTAAGKKHWIGYRDHQTETCDDGPRVIVQVMTHPAPEQDIDALDAIHQALVRQGFIGLEHFVDAGYVTPESIHQAAHAHGFVLTGPVRRDPRAREHPGFTKADFVPDWEARTLTCPRGVTSPPWKPTLGDGHERLSVLFPKPACRAWPRPAEVHRQRRRTGPSHHPAARAPARDPDSSPARAGHSSVAAALRGPRRLRGHRLRDGPRARATALPLPRNRQDPRPARPHRRRNQHRPAQRALPTRHHPAPATPSHQPIPAPLPELDPMKIANSIQDLCQNRVLRVPGCLLREHPQCSRILDHHQPPTVEAFTGAGLGSVRRSNSSSMRVISRPRSCWAP